METINIIEIEQEELERLYRADVMLSCLYQIGVDSWEGYEEALRLYQEEYETV